MDSKETIVFIFGAPEFGDNPEPITKLASTYPNSYIVGCSSAGGSVGKVVDDNSRAVSVARFKSTPIAQADAVCNSAQDSFNAGKSIAEKLNKPDLRGVFVLSDGLKVNGSELVKGMNSVLPDSVVVTGGLAGDGPRFGKTWVIREGKPQGGYITALGFYGNNVQIGHGSKGGWDAFGPERKVTRAEGNVLYELDGKPALTLYKEYLGDQAKGLPAAGLLFPLALRENATSDKSVVRTILAVDEAKQSMTFAGDLPVGHMAQLMKANFERLIEGASGAALSAKKAEAPSGPVLSLAISCVGRRLVLGERTHEELEAALTVLPKGTQQVGFYSYGDISPYTTGHCDLHNQTMTLTTIAERVN